MDIDSIRKVYALSVDAAVEPALTIENVVLSESEIVAMFERA